MSQVMNDAIAVAESKAQLASPEINVLAEHIGSLVRMTTMVAAIIDGKEKGAVRKTFYLTLRAWACDLVGPTAVPAFQSVENYKTLVEWITARLGLPESEVARAPL